ncbi:MAG: molybdopterin-dependent oxidoreductase [Dinoroseobacter sp.]|nr:molybdopterin-dependent oxidoreductase [Dinoroseobacter sp.]
MSLNAYPRIKDWLGVQDNRLVLSSGKVDIGQRISTALIQIAHEELSLPFDRIRVAPVRTGLAPDEGITSGSNSIEQSGRAIRLATATLRAHVVAEAVRKFGGRDADWSLENGALHGPGANAPVDLLSIASELDMSLPVDLDASLREQGVERVRAPMRGMRDLVVGSYKFIHDLDLPGLLHARVVRPPHAKARLLDISQKGRERVAEARLRLVQDGSFLALVGADEWQVIDAAAKLQNACSWSDQDGLDDGDVFSLLTQSNAQRFTIVDSKPSDADIPAELGRVDAQARFERPFTLHGSLAPSAAMAEFSGGLLRVHTHSQGIYALRESMADSLGMSLEDVELTHAPGPGCYGHNGADDAAFEAALIAQEIPDTPILLKWTRADEHAWEPFGTAMAVELGAELDTDGNVSAYSAEAISGTHRGRPRPGPNRAGPARLLANHFRTEPIGPAPAAPNRNRHGGMHRNLDPIYAFADKRLVKNLVDGLPHRTSALRCLGGAVNNFALESFMDELAYAQSRDPVEFRLAHLKDARGIAVLKHLQNLLAERAGEAEALSTGVAYAQYKNAMTRVAVAVEIAVTEEAEIQLERATIVADAGRVIDRAGLEAQLEGGFLQAASWALCEEVTWDRDGITSLDWDSYPVLRFDQVPRIHVHIIDQPNEPAVGAGEAAPGPTLAAIGNALFNATGLRMRRLPLTGDAIRRQALSM